MAYSLEGRQATDTYGIGVALGNIASHSHVFKFGYNGAVSSTEETIWDHGGL